MVCSRIIIIELLAIDFGIRLMDDSFEIIQMIFGFAELLLWFFLAEIFLTLRSQTLG